MKIVLVGKKLRMEIGVSLKLFYPFLKPVHRKGRISVEVLEVKCHCGDIKDGIAF